MADGGIEPVYFGRTSPASSDVPTIIPGPNGQPVYNPVKDFQKCAYLRAVGPADAFPIVLAANGTTFATFQAQAEETDKGDVW